MLTDTNAVENAADPAVGVRRKTKVTAEWLADRRARLPDELMALITERPGRAKTYYLYLPVAEGGPGGISDDKYAALNKLIGEGKVVLGRNRGKMKKFAGLYPAGHPLRDVGNLPEQDPVDKVVEKSLLELVEAEPGRGVSFYTHLPLSLGGVRGSQERKERVMARLVAEGKVIRFRLPKPIKRMTHVIYPLSLSSGAQREARAVGASVAPSEK